MDYFLLKNLIMAPNFIPEENHNHAEADRSKCVPSLCTCCGNDGCSVSFIVGASVILGSTRVVEFGW